jgi:hypothetical protein
MWDAQMRGFLVTPVFHPYFSRHREGVVPASGSHGRNDRRWNVLYTVKQLESEPPEDRAYNRTACHRE